MEWVLLALAAAGGTGSYAAWRLKERRDDRRVQAQELEDVRTLAFEDVTIFGEQLQRLGHCSGWVRTSPTVTSTWRRETTTRRRSTPTSGRSSPPRASGRPTS
jgi:hypothetical protein